MALIRDEAEALADALCFGLCTVNDVIAWADAQILRIDSPPLALCEVALAKDCHLLDVAALLRKCPGTPDQSIVDRLLLGLLDGWLRGGAERADQVARILEELAQAHRITDLGLEGVAWYAWDELGRSGDGYARPREEVVDGLRKALDRAAVGAVSEWSYSFAIGPGS